MKINEQQHIYYRLTKDIEAVYSTIEKEWNYYTQQPNLINSWDIGASHAYGVAALRLHSISPRYNLLMHNLSGTDYYQKLIKEIKNIYYFLRDECKGYWQKDYFNEWHTGATSVYGKLLFQLEKIFNKYNICIEPWETEVDD